MSGEQGAAVLSGVAPNGAGSVQAGREPARRPGSFVSDRQIGQAAARGRRVTFRWFGTQPAHEIVGYIVGMDHYHWLVATVTPPEMRHDGEEPVEVMLVHKARADLIRLARTSTIEDEDLPVQESLRQVGQSFWRHCESTYAGR